jgi:hypothetical protein
MVAYLLGDLLERTWSTGKMVTDPCYAFFTEGLPLNNQLQY